MYKSIPADSPGGSLGRALCFVRVAMDIVARGDFNLFDFPEETQAYSEELQQSLNAAGYTGYEQP